MTKDENGNQVEVEKESVLKPLNEAPMEDMAELPGEVRLQMFSSELAKLQARYGVTLYIAVDQVADHFVQTRIQAKLLR